MKKFMSIFVLTTLLVFSLGTSSSFAKNGFGDTLNTALELWNPNFSDTNTVSLPIDDPNDSDWYVVNNTNGSVNVSFSVFLTPPSGIDLQLQIVRVDSNDRIISTHYVNDGGPGEEEGVYTFVSSRDKVYFRVLSVGPSDYDPNRSYTLQFKKSS